MREETPNPGDTAAIVEHLASSDRQGAEQHQTIRDKLFPIVGIGASAGGLAALKALFAYIPHDTGLAYVIVVHLSPEHESHLEELLQPHVQMPVQQVRETVALEPNRVYVIPPNSNLDTIDTHLRLTALEARRHERAPIDHFFRTLADAHDGLAIGVILTGTGTDGTLGLRRIKEKGGLTVVQDPAEAEYDGMPRSAMIGSPVDLVLPLAEIPQAILRFAKTEPRVSVPDDEEDPDRIAQRLLQRVFAQVRAQTGRDFSHYKRSTLLRRITRRMQFSHLQEAAAYEAFLRAHPQEAQALADDLLITVTSFFRDREVFETLEKDVIPALFVGKGADDTVRVWSVGCSTGEEAYSLAILLLEAAARHEGAPGLQIFASDLHPQSLARAREGFYPGDIEADVGPERLRRFFLREDGGYRVRAEVRELVIFAPHNLLSDPPFSRLDLVSCRNLLIYLERDLHQQIAVLFHYSLLPDGYLLLGTSESTDTAELFRIENKTAGVYRRRNVRAPEPRLPVFPLSRLPVSSGTARVEPARGPASYGALHQRVVELHGPASVLVSPEDNIVHFSAHAGRYLVHPGGTATTSALKLVREELRVELQTAMRTARTHKKGVRTKPILVHFSGDSAPVVLDVRPALEPAQEGFILLIFDEWPTVDAPPKLEDPELDAARPSLSRFRELEAEKQLAEQRLQTIVEEYETSQEEIRASNEELQSANEELRSTLEELETSKEELQSMNEELQTVNQEHRHKVEELGQLSSDLQNLLTATDIATLFLDRELRILRFTPRIGELFNMRLTDRGRPLSDLTHRLGYRALQTDASEVLERLVPIESEVQDEAGRWFLTRVLPYRSADDHIAGIVVTFVDITRQKHAEDQVRQAKENSERILETLPQPLLVLTADLTIQSANLAFYKHFNAVPAQTEGRKVFELGHGQWDIEPLRVQLAAVLSENRSFDEYHVEQKFEDLGVRVMLLNARRFHDRQLILLGIQDVTARYEAEQALRASKLQLAAELTGMQRLHELVRRLLACSDRETALHDVLVVAMEITRATQGQVYVLDKAGDQLSLVSHLGFDRQPLEKLAALMNDERAEYAHAVRGSERVIVEDVRAEPQFAELRAIAESSGFRAVQATPLVSRDGTALGVLSTHYMDPHRPSERDLRLLDLCARQAADFLERLRTDEALRLSQDRLADENRRKDEHLAMLGHELRNPLATIRSATELLMGSSAQDPSLGKAYAALNRQSAHVSRIIDGVLEVTRMAWGKVSLVLAPLDVRAVLDRVLEDSTTMIAGRDLELHAQLADEPLWVRADENRLVQVFDNLMVNAVKFTPPRGHITVTAERDGASAVIRIRDTGVGIRREMLPRIFEAFQQEKQHVDRPTGGLGLGLALVKGLIQLHGGTVEAHSEGLGKGTELVVTLPLTLATPGWQTAKAAAEVSPHRILIVEDNADAAQMLSDLLRRRGHHVTVVETGDEALEALREHGADLVLCDLGLPGMSGHELAQAIRKDSVLQAIPLVALTGYGQPEDHARSAEAGFDAHLVKPAGLAALDDLVRRFGAGRVAS